MTTRREKMMREYFSRHAAQKLSQEKPKEIENDSTSSKIWDLLQYRHYRIREAADDGTWQQLQRELSSTGNVWTR